MAANKIIIIIIITSYVRHHHNDTISEVGHYVAMALKALASKQTTCVLFAITPTESKLSKPTLKYKR